MVFTVEKYIELIMEGKYEEAIGYRGSNIPRKLYKFIYLNDEPECEKECAYLEINNKKLSSLEEGKLWLSTIKSLNDPFELKTLFSKEEVIKSYNYPIEYKRILINSFLDGFLIGSFTTNLTNNMPMWAHYANNHKGFCIEYEVHKPTLFYKVSYENKRIEINNIIMNTINLIFKDIDNTLNNKEKNELDMYRQILLHNSIIKHKSWEYENEYRLLLPKKMLEKFNPITEAGGLVDNEVMGIKPTGIYIGMEATKNTRERLIQISNKLNISLYDMYFDDESTSYDLKYNKIN